MTDPTTGLIDCANPIVHVALVRKVDPDNPIYHAAMAGSFSIIFKKPMMVLIKALNQMETLSHLPCLSVLVKNTLPGTLAFKCKLFPPGHLQECKA